MEYSSGLSAAAPSAGPDPVHVLVSSKSATFPSQHHLPWHVSKNGVYTCPPQFQSNLSVALKLNRIIILFLHQCLNQHLEQLFVLCARGVLGTAGQKLFFALDFSLTIRKNWLRRFIFCLFTQLISSTRPINNTSRLDIGNQPSLATAFFALLPSSSSQNPSFSYSNGMHQALQRGPLQRSSGDPPSLGVIFLFLCLINPISSDFDLLFL